MKRNKKWIYPIVGLLGMYFAKIVGEEFGANTSNIILTIIVVSIIIMILIMFLKKWYWPAIICSSIVLPMIISNIGFYLDNGYMIIGGFVLFFIDFIIVYIILKKYLSKNGK